MRSRCASLARELGVATMSLYRHVRSREELVVLMVDAAFLEAALPRFTRATRETWRARLEAIAALQWEGYRRHPWLAHALSMTRPQATKHGMMHTEAVLAALAPLHLGGPETLLTGVAFIAYVRGMAASLETEFRAEQDTGMTSAEWMVENEAAFVAHLASMPELSRLGGQPDVDMSLDALFRCGLACLLDGLRVAGGEGARIAFAISAKPRRSTMRTLRAGPLGGGRAPRERAARGRRTSRAVPSSEAMPTWVTRTKGSSPGA